MTEEQGVFGGLVQAASDLVARGAGSLRELQADLDERLRKIPNRLNEYGFDAFGLSPESVRTSALPGLLLYRYYFRVETHGIESAVLSDNSRTAFPLALNDQAWERRVATQQPWLQKVTSPD